MPSKAKLIQEGLNVLEALSKDTGLLKEALEAKIPPATTPRGGRLFPQAPMYTPDVPQVDLPRMKKVDVARAAGKKPAYTERMQSLLDSPTVRKKVDKLIEKGEELGMREWYGTEPLRQAAMEAGVSPEQYRSFMAQLASASQRNPVDQQNLMGSFLYHLQQSGRLPEESMLLTNKLRKQLKADPSLAEGKTLIELPPGYGSLAQSDIFERGRQIAGGDIEGALPPEAKLGTFYRNLLGNLRPVTVDVNAVRGPIIEQGDPRWLTSKLVEKDEEGNIKNVYFPRRMVEEGEMSVREAKQRPGFWEAAPSGSEYAGFEDLWQRAAKRHGVEPAEAQALGWYGSGDVTALKTKPELYIDNLERLIRRTSEIEGENPLQTMERILRGETFLKKKKGGGVDLEAEFADGGPPKYSTSQAIKDIVGGGLSNLESMARGSVAGLVGAPGDINELVRDTLGINPFPNLPAAPTSERILKAVPRITAPRKESEGMETLGAFVQPTDALVAAGRGVGKAAKAASPTAAKMAADFYEKAVESGMAVPAKLDVVKPKGGNWLVGGSQAPEGILKVLLSNAAEDRPYINFVQEQNNRGDEFRNWILQQLEQNPEYRSTPGIEAANQFLASRGEPLLQGDPVNSWLKAKLPKYIKNEMGTPEDPIRLQADAWAEEQAGLLAQKDAQIAKAVQKMEKARQARGLTPEEMTRSQEQIRQLRLEREFIAEQRGIHYDPDYLGVNRYRAPDVRNQAGYPKEGMGTSEAARAWEAASDVSINPQSPYIEQVPMSNVAAKAKAYGKTEQEMLNEGLNYIGGQFAVKNPEALAYSINTGTSGGLGFIHLSDELRNAINPESGLPKELLLSAKDLEKMSVPQAVRHVDKINAFRAVQKAEVNAAIAGNAATHTLKEYPEAGKKWVELKVPEPDMTGLKSEYMPEVDMWRIVDQNLGVESSGATEREALGLLKRKEREKMLEDALKYEGEQLSHCVGGYCPDVIRGESRILSLRSDNGRPLATIELGKEQYPNKSIIDAIKKLGTTYPEVAEEAMRRVGIDPANQKAVTEGQEEAFQKAFDDLYKELGGTKTIEINQIKGRRNAPPKEHLNEVMDFLRDNPDAMFTEEGRRDLDNLGIIDLKEQAFGIPPGLPRFITKEKFDRFQKTGKFEPDFKRGGIAKKKRYINVSLLEQEFRHKQKG